MAIFNSFFPLSNKFIGRHTKHRKYNLYSLLSGTYLMVKYQTFSAYFLAKNAFPNKNSLQVFFRNSLVSFQDCDKKHTAIYRVESRGVVVKSGLGGRRID